MKRFWMRLAHRRRIQILSLVIWGEIGGLVRGGGGGGGGTAWRGKPAMLFSTGMGSLIESSTETTDFEPLFKLFTKHIATKMSQKCRLNPKNMLKEKFKT